MKTLLISSLVLFSVSAFAFEDGSYHGSADNQTCDIDLSQTASSLVVNSLSCVDTQLGVETSMDNGTELPMGHTEDYADGYYYVMDVSADAYTFVATNLRSGDVVRESITKAVDGKIHYNLSISEMTNIFDMDLSK